MKALPKPPLPRQRKKKKNPRRRVKNDDNTRRLSLLGKQSLQDLLSNGGSPSRRSIKEVDADHLMSKAQTPESSAMPGRVSVRSPPAVTVPSIDKYSNAHLHSPPALPFRPLPPLPENRDEEGHGIIRIKSVAKHSGRPSRPPAAKSLNEALEGVRKFRESGRIPRNRLFDSDDDDNDDGDEQQPPTPLVRTHGREQAPDPILKMAAKLCRNDIHVTYLQVKNKLVRAFGMKSFKEKKKEVVRLLRWRKEMVEFETQGQEERDVALDAVWGSGTSLIDPVIDPEDSARGVEVEGLPTNAPLSHSYNYLQRQVLGHPFVLIRVIRARGLMSKGARSIVKASNPICTVRVGLCFGETETVENSNQPEWGRQFTFPFNRREHPFAVVEVMHKGSMGSSRFLGRCLVPLTCMKPGRSCLKWYNLLKRSKRSHVSGSIQVQCICSPPLDDDVSLQFQNIRSQESLYFDYGSSSMDDDATSYSRGYSPRHVTSSGASSSSSFSQNNSLTRPPSYRLNMNRYNRKMDEEEKKAKEVEEEYKTTEAAHTITKTPKSRGKLAVTCKMCGKILRSMSRRSPKAEYDSFRFCSRQCALFHSAVEAKGFTVRAQVDGNLSICTEDTIIMRKTRDLLKQSLKSEREALRRLEKSTSPRNNAPKSWIHEYSDLTDRLLETFKKEEIRKEEDLIESEWHAFEDAKRQSKRRRQKMRFKERSLSKEEKEEEEKKDQKIKLMKRRLPPPWESLEVVMDTAEVCVTLTSDSRVEKREKKWIQGFVVLTDWRFVFVETHPEHRANSSEAMSRALSKLKRNAMSFDQFHRVFARTCGQKSLQMLQVPVGCVKKLDCTDSESSEGLYKCLIMTCADMRTIHIRCIIRVNENGRTRSDTLDSISKVSEIHERVARVHRTSELSPYHEKSNSKLEHALVVATIQAQKDSQKITSRPLEMASVSEIEDSKQNYLYDTRNAQLLTAIHAQLALRTINVSEYRRHVAVDSKNFGTSENKLWSSPYNFYLEFRRMGLPNRFWRVSKLNQYYELCDTYPSLLIVPRAVNDDTVRQASKYRSRHRIPTLCWRHRKTGAAMLRCSQPCSGLAGNHSETDEKLISSSHAANPSNAKKRFMIIDARPLLNAVANQMKGKGYEVVNESHYTCCDPVEFMNIGNIHVMRKSLALLLSDCQAIEMGLSCGLEGMDEWFGHVSLVLQAAAKVSTLMHVDGRSTLVHCSDGWDRTPQITALSQIMMDPYYRTWYGFQVLVEKEWISFGHKFADRCGRVKGTHEESPIFIQFCDCVFQMMTQFPTAFEFNSQYLAWIVEHLFSNWFGNFLGNNLRENYEELKVRTGSFSIWECANANKSRFLNPRYDDMDSEYVLIPSCDLTVDASAADLSKVTAGTSLRRHCGDIVLWSDCYLKHASWVMTDLPHQYIIDPVSGITMNVSATVLGYEQ